MEYSMHIKITIIAR